MFALWQEKSKEGSSSIPESADTAGEILSLWEDILKDPDDETGHEAFLRRCYDHGCLDIAARMYQDYLRKNPGFAPAYRYRERIIFLAQLVPSPRKSTRVKIKRFTGIKIMVTFAVISMSWAMTALYVFFGR